jgi:hypothetical protein
MHHFLVRVNQKLYELEELHMLRHPASMDDRVFKAQSAFLSLLELPAYLGLPDLKIQDISYAKRQESFAPLDAGRLDLNVSLSEDDANDEEDEEYEYNEPYDTQSVMDEQGTFWDLLQQAAAVGHVEKRDVGRESRQPFETQAVDRICGALVDVVEDCILQLVLSEDRGHRHMQRVASAFKKGIRGSEKLCSSRLACNPGSPSGSGSGSSGVSGSAGFGGSGSGLGHRDLAALLESIRNTV